jgi:serine/threonine protein kinase
MPLCAYCLLRTGRGREYALVTVLGEGAHGTVYLAEEQPTKRLVALKLLAGSDVEETVTRLQQYQPVLAALEHSRGQRDPRHRRRPARPYVATAYVRGAPIVTFCDRTHADAAGRAMLLKLLTEALNAAHAQGIAHGGIKASNILVGGPLGKPSLRLTDFGMRPGDAASDLAALKTLANGLFVGT